MVWLKALLPGSRVRGCHHPRPGVVPSGCKPHGQPCTHGRRQTWGTCDFFRNYPHSLAGSDCGRPNKRPGHPETELKVACAGRILQARTECCPCPFCPCPSGRLCLCRRHRGPSFLSRYPDRRFAAASLAVQLQLVDQVKSGLGPSRATCKKTCLDGPFWLCHTQGTSMNSESLRPRLAGA